MIIKKFPVFFYFIFCLLAVVFAARADETSEQSAWSDETAVAENITRTIRLDEETIIRGYTVALDTSFKISLTPGILSKSTAVEIIKLNEELAQPWKYDLLSPVYQFDFKNKEAYSHERPFYLQISYPKQNHQLKKVMFFDKNYNGWRPLPTVDFPAQNFVRALIHLPFARLAIFADPERLDAGLASWYKYKPGNFAASPDWPIGSRLRVHSLLNNKFVDVTINDYGPDRRRHPNRVIDLEKEAFLKISSLSEGVIGVRIEPLFVSPSFSDFYAAVGSQPQTTAESALIFSEDNNTVLLEKNGTTSRPLASLTKIMAAKVFLDTKPDLTKIIAYKIDDEKYNYEYCQEWESARVKLNAGDELTLADALYASLVGSANNTVETLVRASGLSRPDFIAKMNEMAAAWGASGTVFVEPTGLSPDNLSTVRDLALLAQNVFREPAIRQAAGLAEYSFTTINTKKAHRIKNTNKLLASGRFNFTGAKTGYLEEAGYCLVLRAPDKQGRNVIAITMNIANREQSFRETADLLAYGLRSVR